MFLFILFKLAQHAVVGIITWSLLVVYIQGIQKLQGNLKGFLNAFVSLIQQRIFLADLFKFLDIQIEEERKRLEKAVPPEFDLVLKDVSFCYPGSEQFALDKVSLRFPRGKVIGIVGANGSGKSTLVKLLAGIYEPTTGEIFTGDTPLHQWDPKDWRSQALFLFQDFQKYFFSIHDIVSLGTATTDSNSEKVKSALVAAESWEFVSQLQKGINARIGRVFMEGKGLSGGQWQKLAISRAFFRNPNVLVLDEPTSGIDALAETQIFNAIRSNSKERITILITHRLYNLKEADLIYVFDQGKVVQSGGFELLASQEGIFKSLYANQQFG